jgi:hypothetical protein
MIKKLASFGKLFRKKNRKRTDEIKVPYGISDNRESGLFGKHGDHTFTNMQKWEKMYAGDGLVFSAVNAISQSALGNGYEIKSSNEDARQIILEFLNNVDMDELLSGIIRHAIIFGDAYLEKIFSNNGDLVSLDLIDPKTIEIVCNEYGDIQYYKQNIKDKYHSEIIDKENIIHVKLYSIPSSPYGVSTIGSNYDTIQRKIRMDEAIAASLLRHGSPKYHVSVGSPEEGEYPPKEVLTDLKNEFKDIDEKNEFITSSLIKINGIDVRGIEHIEEYYTYFIDLISSGFCVPAEQLGITVKGNTEASSKTRERLFNRYLAAIQKRVERLFQREVFPILLQDKFPNKIVSFKFNDISPSDESQKVKWVRPFIQSLDRGEEILTRDEIRKIFGYEPFPKIQPE